MPAAGAAGDDVYELVVGVAAGHDALDEIATALREVVEGPLK